MLKVIEITWPYFVLSTFYQSKEAEGNETSLNNFCNFLVHTKGICIQILSEEDGRQDLVDVTNEISEDVNSGVISPSEIDAIMVGSQLKGL